MNSLTADTQQFPSSQARSYWFLSFASLRLCGYELFRLELFAEHGFETTSISSVAKAAGIGKGTVYEYFSSKEELISSAFMAWLEGMMGEELEELLLTIEDPEERLRKCVQAMMEPFCSDERTVKLTLAMFQMMLKDDKFLLQNPAVGKIFQVMRKIFVDILLEGVAQGVFRPEIARNAEKIAINLFAYLDGIAFHYFLNRNEIELMPQVDFYLEHLISVIRNT